MSPGKKEKATSSPGKMKSAKVITETTQRSAAVHEGGTSVELNKEEN